MAHDTMTSADLIDATSISYRELDYWARTGVLEPIGHATPGSGNPRLWRKSEITAVRALVDVKAAFGLHPFGSGPLTARRLTEAARAAHPARGRWLVLTAQHVIQATDLEAATGTAHRLLVELRWP